MEKIPNGIMGEHFCYATYFFAHLLPLPCFIKNLSSSVFPHHPRIKDSRSIYDLVYPRIGVPKPEVVKVKGGHFEKCSF